MFFWTTGVRTMSEKWHINDRNQVERCHAHFRKCPFRDFDSKGQAQYHLEWMDTQRRADDLERQIRTSRQGVGVFPNGHQIRDTNKLIDILDSENSRLLSLTNEITSPKGRFINDVTVEMSRNPKLQREVGMIISDWMIVVKSKNSVRPDRSEVIVLDGDFNYHFRNNEGGNYSAALEQVRAEIRARAVPTIQYSGQDTSAAVSDMLDQVEDHFASVETEMSNDMDWSYEVLDTCGNHFGTFGKSDILGDAGITVSGSIDTTLFRGRSAERFIKDSTKAVRLTDEIPTNVWLYHAPQGVEGPWWGVSCEGRGNDLHWTFQARRNDSEASETYVRDAGSPQELSELVADFEKNEMPGYKEDSMLLPRKVHDIASSYNAVMDDVQRDLDSRRAADRNGTREILDSTRRSDTDRNALDEITDIFS